jgi:methyl-accepting chemotaxis protein
MRWTASIATKVTATLGISLLLMVALWGVSSYAKGLLLQRSEAIVSSMEAVRVAGAAHAAVLRSRRLESDTVFALGQKDLAELRRSYWDKAMQETGVLLARLRPMVPDAVAREELDRADKALRDYGAGFLEVSKAIESGMLGDASIAEGALAPAHAHAQSAEKALLALAALLSERASAERAGMAEASSRATQAGLGLLAFSLLVGVTGGLLLWRSVVRPLREAVDAAQAVARGDLTQHMHTAHRDEFGLLFVALGTMQAQLRRLISEVNESVCAVSNASTEIAAGNADLSQRTSSTASSLQATAAAVEELSATIQHNAENAQQAQRLARGAAEVADEGGTAVAEVVTTMGEINAQAARIGEIVALIDGIAFQTNILALNAAVEAARAGEQGRGFAVVAGEVGTLSQRSAEAARQIRGLIGDSVRQIREGTGKVRRAGETMGRVVEAIQGVSQAVDGISRASSEQAGGIGQVSVSVSKMDAMTQQNADLVRQAASATESLKGQAERVVELLGRFTMT